MVRIEILYNRMIAVMRFNVMLIHSVKRQDYRNFLLVLLRIILYIVSKLFMGYGKLTLLAFVKIQLELVNDQERKINKFQKGIQKGGNG